MAQLHYQICSNIATFPNYNQFLGERKCKFTSSSLCFVQNVITFNGCFILIKLQQMIKGIPWGEITFTYSNIF